MATSVDFGKDVSCASELKSGRYVTGARLIGESYFRRLTTPRGMLRGGEAEADFGLDLLGLIGSVQTSADIASLPGRISNELMKDERSLSIDVEIIEGKTADGVGVKLDITIKAVTSAGPFELQIAASAVSAELLGIRSEAT
jgi:hypothetical protein